MGPRDSFAGLGRLANHDELVDTGDRGGSHGVFRRLPAHPVLAQPRDDVRGRRVLPVRSDAFGLDHPLVAIARVEPFAVAPLGVEDPGLELSLERVPADPLAAGSYRPAPGLDGKLAFEEVAALGPFAG